MRSGNRPCIPRTPRQPADRHRRDSSRISKRDETLRTMNPILAKLQTRIAIKEHQAAIRSLSTNPDTKMKFNPKMDGLLAQLEILEARTESRFPGAKAQARELHRSSFNGGGATLTRPPAPAPAPAKAPTEAFDARYKAARKAGGSELRNFLRDNHSKIKQRLRSDASPAKATSPAPAPAPSGDFESRYKSAQKSGGSELRNFLNANKSEIRAFLGK